MKKMHQYMLHIYFSIRNFYPFWFWVLNYPSRRYFAAHLPTLSDTESAILKKLRTDGIAFTSLEELFPNQHMLEKLQEYAKSIEGNETEKSKKKFLVGYWDTQEGVLLDIRNPFVQLALHDRVLSIVNSYQQFATQLNYYTLEKTLPVGDSEPTFSQRWHRDPEEVRTCKIFLYLNDVDETAGPFIYVRGSAPRSEGRYAGLFPQIQPLGAYPDTKELEKRVDEKDIVKAVGKAGTVIFCDTAGLHRGGYAKSNYRLMFTAFYPSRWWTDRKHWFYPEDKTSLDALSPQAKYALSLE